MAKTILWVTDPHLNHLKQDQATFVFGQSLREENSSADCLIVSGDISEGKQLETHLKQLAEGFGLPIYFVLGNHDYYMSSFAKIDDRVSRICDEVKNLHCLNHGEIDYQGISIVGCGGWYDARYGNKNSEILLNDWELIAELRPGCPWVGERWAPAVDSLDRRSTLLELIRTRADAEASVLAQQLERVDSDVIFVVTHVPPYAESAWHEGRPSEPDWVPWFSSAATGQVLDNYSEKHPDRKLVVLTGHSHGSGIFQKRDNLIVFTGPARYGIPDVAGWIGDGKIIAYNELGRKVEHEI